MTTVMFAPMMLILLLGGGNNAGDLLDFTPTQAYWEMRDQRIIDAETMSAVLRDEDATSTDKLMAIRALGELAKAEDAKPNVKADVIKWLTPLAQSKEPFVGQYAKRSIAWAKGVAPEAQPTLPAMASDLDLALFPADTTLVGQMKVANTIGPIDLAAMLPDVKMDGQSMRDMMMQQMTPGILQATQMVGNVRADLVTAGMYLENEDDFWFMASVRGQYDRTKVQIALEEAMGDDEKASFYSIGDVEVVHVQHWDPFAILMPSDDLFVFIGSENREAKLPIEAVAKKLAQAGRKPVLGGTLAKQVNAIDREKADVWVAMHVTEMLKNKIDTREVFGAFDAGRAVATRSEAGTLAIQWVAEGSDEAAVGKAAHFFAEQVQEGLGEIKEGQAHMPAEMQVFMKPVIEMMESIKFKHEGKTMTGGMKVDPKIGFTMPMMFFQVGEPAMPQADEAALVQEALEAEEAVAE